MRLPCIPSSVLALLAAAPAQSFVVSPPQYDKHEGNVDNTFPFGSSGAGFRYQEVRADLRNSVRVLQGIGWRRDGVHTDTVSYGARTVDMQLSIGDGDYATFSSTYANNFSGTPVVAFARKMVNLPDHRVLPDIVPAPWDFDLLFDVPFVYLGTKDLLHDITVWSISLTTGWYMDAANVTASPNTLIGGFSSVDTGCTTANGVMKLRSRHVTSAIANNVGLSWTVAGAPSSAPSAILVGFADPALPVANLCGSGKLHSDNALLSVPGTTSTAGAWTTPTLTVPFNPIFPLLPGLVAQAASADATQGVFPFATSNGITSPIPPLPVTVQATRLYATNMTATTGALGTNFSLVTRFRY